MKRLHLTFIPLLATFCLLPTATFSLPIASNRLNSILLASTRSTAQIGQIAQAVTVRIFTPKRGGSGVLIGKAGQTYTVLTNAHVVNAKGTFKIQTPDGKIHQATIKYRGDSLQGNDLALLQFTSKNHYQIAELATNTNLPENQEVYAAGFPYDTEEFTFTTGKISLVSARPFIGGYQIGYTNEIQQGMSGGALLNGEGKLIGVNGLLKYPILNEAYTYQDGSQPKEELRQQLRQLSFAVPIQTLGKVAPQLAVSPPDNSNNRPVANSPSSSPKLTGLPGEIDNIAQQITVKIDAHDPKNGSGSGVIMARQGQTYYILTNDHVVENPDEYTVVTPDGQKYPIKPNDIVKENGLDVAILKFTSKQTYQIATLAKYNLSDNQNHWIFFSGFPAEAGGKRQFNPGFRFSREQGFFETKDTVSQLSNGYELVFTNLSLPGMSGGALLDLKGRVIGIGGQQEGETVTSKLERYLGYAFGVPTTAVLGLATKAGIKPEWMKLETTPPPTLTDVQAQEMLEQPAFAVAKPSKDDDKDYWLNYGNQLWRLQKYDEAVAALQQAIEKNPEFYQAYYVLGLVQQSQGKYEKAVATFEQVTQLNLDYYQAWREKSSTLTALKKYSEALTAIDKAIELNSEQATDDNSKDFILYVNKGNILSELKRYKEAEAAYTEAIKIKPSELAYNNRGVVRGAELKQYPEALADCNQALAINPQYAYAYLNRGNVRAQLKQYPEAIADYTQALAINPQSALAYYNRGVVRTKLKQYPEAIADYNQALAINPQSALAYLNRGVIRTKLKQYPEAIADYNQAIEINPQFVLAYNNRGNVRAQLKQYPEAIADYTQAIKINPQYALAYNNRGLVSYELKDNRGAIEDLNTAAQLFYQQGNIDLYQLAQQKLREVQSSPR